MENNNFAYENQGTISFLVYNLSDDDVIDTITSGMLLNNRIDALIPYTFSQLNTKRSFKYNVTSKVTLKNYFTGTVNKKMLVGVLKGITNAIMESEEYLISADKFVFDPELIFVDVSNYTSFLVCLPLENRNSDIVSVGEFIKSIMYSVKFDQSEDCDYVAQIISFLNGATFSISNFNKLLNDLTAHDSKQVVMKQPPIIPNIEPADQNQGLNMPQPSIAKIEQVQKNNSTHKLEPKKEPMQPPKPAIEKQVKQEQKPPMPKSNMGFEVPGMQGKVFADEQKADNAKKKDKKGGFFSSIFGGNKKNEEKNDGDVNTNPSPKNPPPQNPIFNNQNSRVEITPVKISENQEKPQGIHQVLIPLEESEYERTTILNPQAPISPDNAAIVKNQNVLPYLVRKKTDEKIVINKAFFKMGKEPDYVDYLCDNNPAVSRSHADIITRNNEYFIRDNNSTNGTFVNKVRIVGNQEVKIKHEDVITLADEVFEFRIY